MIIKIPLIPPFSKGQIRSSPLEKGEISFPPFEKGGRGDLRRGNQDE